MFEVMGFDENLRKWMEVHFHAISWSLGVLKRVKLKGFSFSFFFLVEKLEGLVKAMKGHGR